MKKSKLSLALLSILTTTIISKAYDSEFSIDYWTAIPHGYLKSGSNKVIIKDDLKVSTAKDLGGKLLFKEKEETNLPNIVFMYTPVRFEGKAQARKNITFRDLTIHTGQEFKTTIDFISYDLGFLWDVGHLRKKTEDRLDFRAGFSIRYIERNVEIISPSGKEEENHKDLKPMLDLEAEVEVLPVHQELRAEIILEAQMYSNGNEYIFDIIDSIRMNYKNMFAEVGYRVEKFKMADDVKKVSASGIFGSIGLHF